MTGKTDPGSSSLVVRISGLILGRIFPAAVLVIALLMVRPVRMGGNVFDPSLRDGDLCLFRRTKSAIPGDFVLIRENNGSSRIGRVVASAGDSVGTNQEGKSEVNGQSLRESWPEASRLVDDEIPVSGRISEDDILVMEESDDGQELTLSLLSCGNVEGRLVFLFRRRGF